MKLSDVVAQFICDQGVTHVFGISGGASLHLIHSVSECEGLAFIAPSHEQAAAMAADGYARATGKLGVAVATSGPGATNLLTGVASAYYDSVPTLFLTGQVATFRFGTKIGVKQFGFQETSTLEIFRSVTKYAVQLERAEDILYELGKAVWLATNGRPGPVLIDLPDDLQRTEVDVAELRRFTPPTPDTTQRALSETDYEAIWTKLSTAERPLVIAGWGVRLSGAESVLADFLSEAGIPLTCTWGAMDLVTPGSVVRAPTFGTHGTRAGNFIVQNADCLLVLGSRLDTHEIGSPPSSFGREASKIIVDIDETEIEKFPKIGVAIDQGVHADVGEFLRGFVAFLRNKKKTRLSSHAAWQEYIREIQIEFPCAEESPVGDAVDPYELVGLFSKHFPTDAQLILDTGCGLAWMAQGFLPRGTQRVFHDFNFTAMGWALPAAVGAYLGTKRTTFCLSGDGSLQMNLQELSLIRGLSLPIKIILLNNHGHSMIQQTQDQWLGSKYFASSIEGGLTFPDFPELSRAYGFPTFSVRSRRDLEKTLIEFLDVAGSAFLNIEVPQGARVVPQVKFGRPIEDPEPLLARGRFRRWMTVKPMPQSEGV